MPHPCVVCGRSRMNPNNREEDYMFFGFPVNYDDRCTKWLEFCCREDLYKLSKKQLLQRMVCSKHFEKKDFLNEYQDRLNCTGVPSIYEPTQSLYNITCVLCGKSRKDPPGEDYDGTTFHHFPGEEFRCLKWLDFVGIDSYYRLTRKEILYCYICSNHFDKSQFMIGYKARLVDNAVPNIRHPGRSDQGAKLPKISYSMRSGDKTKKLEPLPTAVLESQACAACGRLRADPRNKLERYKFHPFPAYEIGRCLRWCQFLGREDLLKMSPNQIRKLVLCSKHFLSGQSFHKVGPCDAVPTIKEISDSYSIERVIADLEQDDNDDEESLFKMISKNDERDPLVSSKKPKIDNKPTPLAKKRGRSKRSTSINIPKVDNLNSENCIKKIAIPAANWKIHFPHNQFQPLTIANTNSSNTTITTDGKKVILPFPGNISNLGAPIPVNSLSSIPPGFLIKINLPEQQEQKNAGKASEKKERQKKNDNEEITYVDLEAETRTSKRLRATKSMATTKDFEKMGDAYRPGNQDLQGTRKSRNCKNVEQKKVTIPDIIEVLDGEYVDLNNSYGLEDGDDQIHVYQEIPENETWMEEEEGEVANRRKAKKRVKRSIMTPTTRRTLLPIRTEVRHFLHKLKPHMRRLPRKAKAQLKLSIVNLVIDRL